jgi:DNA mismatch repair protein MutH
MDRDKALIRLKDLTGLTLQELAPKYGVTIVSKNGRINKGWAGHVIERFLGLQINSAQSPNFGSWELKSIPLKQKKDGSLAFKETMAITMIDSFHVCATAFEDSHLLSKLRKAVVVARVVGADALAPSVIHSINTFDLDGQMLEEIRRDYEAVRAVLRDPSQGFEQLTGKMGKYVQPRTKGAGHGSKSRAFYARPALLQKFINLQLPIPAAPIKK